MKFRIRGPKGGVVVRQANEGRLAKLVPALVKRFHKVTVDEAPQAPSPSPLPLPRHSDELRGRIVEYCRWGIAHEQQIHYAQERPMERLKTPGQLKTLPRNADCSEFATDAYAYAGAPDPNGMDYDGTGYTGTMLGHCRHIAKKDAKPGDLAVFGPGAGHHVVVLLEAGTANSGDPVICSHGQEKGPLALYLSQESPYQPAPITFLSCID